MKKVLVTGCAGFIGSHLCDALIKNYEVIGIDNLATGHKEYINPKVKFHKIDIRSAKVIDLMKDVDTVFHLAAAARIQPSIVDPSYYHDNNLNGTFNLLQAAVKNKVRRFVFSSSSSAYGIQKAFPETEDMVPNPLNPYAAQKLMGEIYMKVWAQCYGLETVSFRYFNVYGPRQIETGPNSTVIGIFLDQMRNNKPLTIVGNGQKKRDYTHVKDVVRANIQAMKSKKVGAGEVINIGTTKTYSINQVAKMISKNHVFIPDRQFEAIKTLADVKLAKKLLDWEPVIGLEEGIKDLLENEKN